MLELESTRNIKMKDTVTERKYPVDELHCRFFMPKEGVSEPKGQTKYIFQNAAQGDKRE